MRQVSAIKAVWLICVVLAAGCASAPRQRIEGYSCTVGEKATKTALDMVGRPYKYKGDSPSGFDCSGLVRYSYLAAGIDVPHGTAALKKYTRPVSAGELTRGDLLFFNENGKASSHVGIYTGKNRFVHAPSKGKRVRVDTLLDPYWKKHFAEARRFN